MQSGTVIKVSMWLKIARREGGEALVINDFVFKTAPEGFDEGVIVALAFAAHVNGCAASAADKFFCFS